MRLLKINHDGNFSLTKFRPHDIPPYAILSHTWETDDQELTFQDMIEGTGRSKAGYRKIQFCGDQAKKDGLQYFWVDSCCIDKSSSTELSEAVNSMFRWYQNAVKCYVYLLDISNSDVTSLVSSSQLPDNSPFRHSKWFTRGWTLQELLAPSSVEFFSKESDYLGDKRTLELHISDITGIAVKALQGTPMSHFSLDERISWADKRKTTIEEDQAYCLLGIFEVHMPLIYGEGRKNAFRRLREVAKFTSKHESFSTVPFAPDPDFVDRPEILAWVRDKCAEPGARAALVGLGGVGYVNVPSLCHNANRRVESRKLPSDTATMSAMHRRSRSCFGYTPAPGPGSKKRTEISRTGLSYRGETIRRSTFCGWSATGCATKQKVNGP
jgi:Heterokaryon incompatibility protein (HET)